MKTVRLPLKNNGYDIVIGHKIISRLGGYLKTLNLGKDAVIITNPVIQRHHGQSLARSLKRSGCSVKVFEVPAGERSKSARQAIRLMEKIARYDVKRSIFIVAFGGGVIGDLAGFVAAAYKRGIPYIQVPTTFLAQIDSAIGGKVGIDLAVGKNLAGAFYQPKIVFSDVSLLSTLTKRQMRNGLAEAVKYGVIRDKDLFKYIQGHYSQILDTEPRTLEKVVLACSRIKAGVVKMDERETKSIRTILNFGHTVGHAVEAAGKYKLYHHGEAIALGMRVAADISRRLKLCSAGTAEDLNAVLSDIGLPQRIERLRLADILDVMQHDKKFVAGRNRFVLAERIGRVRVVEDVPLTVIKKAVRQFS